VDFQAARLGHEGVTELVQQNRDEEQHRGGAAQKPVGGAAQMWVDLRKVGCGKGPGHECKDDQPAVMYANLDAADAPYLQGAFH